MFPFGRGCKACECYQDGWLVLWIEIIAKPRVHLSLTHVEIQGNFEYASARSIVVIVVIWSGMTVTPVKFASIKRS